MSEPMTYYKPIRRIRQACHNCRRKKARCPGQKPACSFCVRLNQPCSYSDDEQLRAASQQTTSTSSSATTTVSAGSAASSSTQRYKGRVRSRMGSTSTARSTPEPTTDAELSEAMSAPVQTVTPYVPKNTQTMQQHQVQLPQGQTQQPSDLTGRIMAMEMQMSSLADSIKSLESTLAKFATTMTETLSMHTRSTSATNTATPTQDAMDTTVDAPVDGTDATRSAITAMDMDGMDRRVVNGGNTASNATTAPQPGSYTRLPPPEVIDAAADLYFRYCHNQPYSLFHEASFRQKIKAREVPTHLLFALVASTVRYSSDQRFFAGVPGGRAAATVAYAQQSWKAIVVPWNGLQSDAELSVVQTILLLAIIDYTEGRTQASWIKVGLAIRLCQDFRLMVEPDASLPPAHQEERRRVFWSFYLCDKLISCGRERPATILDDHCRLRLPCDEDVWRSDTLPDAEQRPPTLGQLTADAEGTVGGAADSSPAWSDTGTTELSQLSPFAVTVLVTSLLGRCAQYALGEQEEQTSSGKLPPWSPRSKYSALHSAVLHLESELGLNEPVATKIARSCLKKKTVPGVKSKPVDADAVDVDISGDVEMEIDSHRAAPLAFSHAIFYLCQCLLYHPFLLWQRLAGVGQRTPQSFVLHTRSACHNAARALSQLMGDIRSLHTERLTTSYDPFYGYSNMVAGVVHVLFLEAADAGVRQAAAAGYAASLENLENLGVYWKSCARMRARLHDFHTATQTAISAGRPRFAHIVDPDPTTLQKQTGPQALRIDPTDANDLMECLDYARMSTTTRRRTQNTVQGQSSLRETADVEGSTASVSSNNVNNGPTTSSNNTYINNAVPAGVSAAGVAVPADINNGGHGYDTLQYGLGSYGAYGHAGHGMYPAHHNNGGAHGAGCGTGDDSSSGGTGLTPLSQLPSPFFEELVNLLPFPSSRPMTPRHFDAMFEPPMPQVQQVQQVEQVSTQNGLQQHPDMSPYHTNKPGGYGGQTGPTVLGFP